MTFSPGDRVFLANPDFEDNRGRTGTVHKVIGALVCIKMDDTSNVLEMAAKVAYLPSKPIPMIESLFLLEAINEYSI